MALFVLVLMVSEAIIYELSGESVSIWAMVIAGVSAAFGFAPVVNWLHRWMDRLLFPQHLNVASAIRQLGADDLADLSIENIETTLLERICKVSRRRYAALDERHLADGKVFVYPPDAPPVPDQPCESGPQDAYEVCMKLRDDESPIYLLLGPREDEWPLDAEERRSLEGLARFAAITLEHARLTRQQSREARLDSISRIAQQLHSHDLKNRLHDLSFLAHHLESGKLDDEDVRRLVQAIGRVTGRMRALMDRMADPNAPLEVHPTPLDLNGLVEKTVHERLWPEGVRVETRLGEIPAAAGDEELLRGVLHNLYDNAVQAMNSQGVLGIETGVADDAGARMAYVRVKDTGCGIDPDFLKHRLFELFGTNKAHGLGVGLYLSRRIMRAHGGDITAESPGVGQGATFTIRLPLWSMDDKLVRENRGKEAA